MWGPHGRNTGDRYDPARKGWTGMTGVVERVQGWRTSAVQFFREVRAEMKKVTWPQRKEVAGSTAVVIAASFLVAFFLGAVDLVLQKLLALVIG